jgi:hypothetical protein
VSPPVTTFTFPASISAPLRFQQPLRKSFHLIPFIGVSLTKKSNDKRRLIQLWFARAALPQVQGTKKADVVEHPEVFDHVGLLVNGLPGVAELPFI